MAAPRVLGRALVSRPVRTVEEAGAYLDGLINRERPEPMAARVSLRPIQALLAALGHPESDLRILHIAAATADDKLRLHALFHVLSHVAMDEISLVVTRDDKATGSTFTSGGFQVKHAARIEVLR